MKINKKSKTETEISTASMPDIVFLLLFFFMVSATIKPNENKVKAEVPKAMAVSKVKKKFLVKTLQIGYPKDHTLGSSPRIFDGHNFIKTSDIGQWVLTQKSTLDEVYKDQMIVLIKADKEIDMGLISDVQTELRKSNARKVLFRTLETAL